MDKNTVDLMFSHDRDDWQTPPELIEYLKSRYGELFDPCPKNPTFDGLNLEWPEKNYVNPPYSKVKLWLEKAYTEHLKGKFIIFLMFARTDTKAFHQYAMKANEIWFIKGRLKFSGSKNAAPFPSMIIVYDNKMPWTGMPLIKTFDLKNGNSTQATIYESY